MTSPIERSSRLVSTLHGLLLRAYPRRFRERFEVGLRYAFSEELARTRRKGRLAVAWFLAVTGLQTLFWALKERLSPTGGPDRKTSRNVGGFENRSKGGWEVMTVTLQELRFALRRLGRAPVYALTAMLTLGLGIGASTAIFSVVYGVLLKPLPYPDADRVVRIGHLSKSGELSMADGAYFQYSENAGSFEELAIYVERSAPILGTGEPLELGLIVATPSLFDVLGIEPALGRPFTEEDAAPGVDDVAIISHDYWVSHLGRDPEVLGKPVVEGANLPIVGVLPQGFRFVRPETRVTFGNPFEEPDVYLPLTLRRASARFGNFIYQGLGRLAPRVTVEEAERELLPLMMQAPEAYPGGHTVTSLEEGGYRPVIVPIRRAMVGHVAQVLWILMGAVSFVLLIATANVANLFLVRAEARWGEIAVRRAMGAGRGALARSFFAESVLLSLSGGALGVGLAATGTRILLRMAPAEIPRLDQVGLDPNVLAFAAVTSILAGIGFGALPLFRFGAASLGAAVSQTTRGATADPRRSRGRGILVVAQIGLAVVLLVGSGLLLETFRNLRRVDPGFDSSGVLTLRLSLAANVVRAAGIEEERADVGRSRFLLELTRRLEELPGIESAAFSADLPLNGEEWRDHVVVEGAFPGPEELGPIALRVFMGPGYLETIGARLLRGRELERRDFEGFPDAVVVNESFAKLQWPGEDPVGKRLVQWPLWKPDQVPWYTVVGVVDDIHEESLMTPPEPTVYLPTYFLPTDGFTMWVTNMVVVLKTTGHPMSHLSEVRQAILELHPEVPINSVETLPSVEAHSFQQVSFAMVLVVVAGGVALVLGIVGIYGLVAYVVSRRTTELGLRIALGATAGDVRRTVLTQGSVAGLLGIALGVIGALASGRVLESMLFGVSSADLRIYVSVCLGLVLVVLAASLGPAQRATRVDPAQAMRADG